MRQRKWRKKKRIWPILATNPTSATEASEQAVSGFVPGIFQKTVTRLNVELIFSFEFLRIHSLLNNTVSATDIRYY
jgi:hypothetical protein